MIKNHNNIVRQIMDEYTFENSANTETEKIENQEYYALKRYYYPQWLYISLFLSIIYSTYSIYTFITEDLKHHIRLKNQLEIANRCFLNKEYKEYIFMYKTCLKELSEDASTQIKLAKANFVLSETDSSYFINGVNLLNQKQLKLSEFNEILSFVPEKYTEAFKSCFK